MSVRPRQTLLLLLSALQAARLYSPEHPQFLDLVDRAHNLLTQILEQKREWTVGFVGEDIVSGEEVFFDLGERKRLLCLNLREKSVEWLSFLAGLEKEELRSFLAFLALPQKRTEKDLADFLALEGIRHIRAGRLTAPSRLGEEGEIRSISLPASYQSSISSAARIIDHLLRREEVSPLDLRYLALDVLEHFSGEYWHLLSLWPNLQSGFQLVAHLVNTAVLTMTASSRMAFPREDILDLGVAALFHDIGKVSRFGIGPLGGENHMVAGARILLEYKDSLSVLPAIVAFEHHLRFDLKGQPKFQGAQRPHEASLIVAISNVYDSLLRKWAYDERFNPLFVYQLMLAEKGRVFAPDFIDLFFQVMGIWPEGLQVNLSDGRLARVVRVNENAPLAPRVEILTPGEAGEIIDLSQQEGKISILSAVSPFTR